LPIPFTSTLSSLLYFLPFLKIRKAEFRLLNFP
jgi:hypothetical protein